MDATWLLKPNADNVIAVKVSNANASDVTPILPAPPKKQDFTVFGGLHRPVHLLVTNQLCVSPLYNGSPGVFLSTSNVSSTSANVQIKTKVRNRFESDRQAKVVADIFDSNNQRIRSLTSSTTITANTTKDVVQKFTLAQPHLWNGLADPCLYRVVVTVCDSAGRAVDSVTQPLGIRSFRLDPNKGFFLNGKPLDLHGVNMHQDHLNQGDNASAANAKQDVSLLQEIGATMVRLAHDQHSQATYDLLDRAGIISWSEIPIWSAIGTDSAFVANAKQQLSELILQNYNHPSIVFWGVFNEIEDSTAKAAVVSELKNLAKATDPGRIVVAASNLPGAAKVEKVPEALALNAYFGWYKGVLSDLGPWLDYKRGLYPNIPLGISEYGAGASIFHHMDSPTKVIPTSQFHPEEYQNLLHESYWATLAARKWLWCKLVWQMFDTAADQRLEGDQPGRNDKGLVTFDRKTKKDAFYFYKANWSDQPVLYIADRRFTQRTSAKMTVKIYSNCDAVTLRVNGRVIGNMTAQPNHVFTRTGVALSAGANTITVSGTRRGKTYQDSCQWTVVQKAA
jgi:beta-galactosidase